MNPERPLSDFSVESLRHPCLAQASTVTTLLDPPTQPQLGQRFFTTD
jgi:hypothetical protein